MKRLSPEIICIGHRGAAGHAPENTLDSIETAMRLGAGWIEIDVHAVHDEILVIHDHSLNRTTSGRGHMRHYSLSHLRSLDAGNGEKIPLLSEVFDRVDRRAGLHIELKGPGTAVRAGRLISEKIRAGWPADKIVVSSFRHARLRLIRRRFPRIPIGVLYHLPGKGYTRTARELGAVSVHLPWRLIRKAWIREAHEANLRVLAYTVNHTAAMRRLIRWGVDGFFSDYPDRVIAVRRECD